MVAIFQSLHIFKNLIIRFLQILLDFLKLKLLEELEDEDKNLMLGRKSCKFPKKIYYQNLFEKSKKLIKKCLLKK